MTPEEALALAESVLQGKPTEACPIPFSYVQAGIVLSRFVTAREREVAHLTAQRDAVQTRCTELLNELRAYRRSGICLPGWWCPCEVTDKSPGIFNGAGKEQRTHCRVCGAPRPA